VSKKEIEEEIVAKYTEGWSLAKIEKEYDLTAFELAYYLGKNKVPPRQTIAHRIAPDITMVNKDKTLKIPKKIVNDLNFKYGQKTRFLIFNKEKLQLQLEIVEDGNKET
jgi:hypothetical protein